VKHAVHGDYTHVHGIMWELEIYIVFVDICAIRKHDTSVEMVENLSNTAFCWPRLSTLPLQVI
jgi:uncharacterized metal-binding protein